MTPLQMKYFDTVCRFQNISKAAAYLHISQPTITVAIQSLESELGIKLFYRNGKHLLLTQEGSVIWDKVASILSHIEQLEKEIRDVAHNKNHIRLGVPLQIGVKLLPKLFNEFKALHPEINLEICEAGGIEALQLIERDELDMAITNYDNNFSDNLSYKKIGENEEAENDKWYVYLEIITDSLTWFNNQCYVDTLNPEAIKKFVEITHERYKEVTK